MLNELSKIPSVIEKDLALTQLSEEFNLSKDALQIQLNELMQANKRKEFQQPIPKRPEIVIPQVREVKKVGIVEKAEMLLIFRVIREKATFQKLNNQEGFSFVHDNYQELFQHIASFYELYGQIELADFINYLKEDYLRNLLITITMQNFSEQSNEQEIKDCIEIIEKASIQFKIDTLKQQQQESKHLGDTTKEMEVTLEIIQLQKELSNWG